MQKVMIGFFITIAVVSIVEMLLKQDIEKTAIKFGLQQCLIILDQTTIVIWKKDCHEPIAK